MKIVLVDPWDETGLSEMAEPAHGLGYIAAVLKAKGHDIKVIDGKVSKIGTEEIAVDALDFGPAMVGITAMTPDILCADKIARSIKAQNPKISIVIGGAHVSALPLETLQEFTAFDFGVVGEAEETALELAQGLESGINEEGFSSIKGLVFKDRQGKARLNEPRPWIDNLDDIPFPAWELFPVSPSGEREFAVVATRGCPFRCKFCMRMMGNIVRKRSPENIIEEIFRNKELSTTNFFWFSDETFGVDKVWLDRLLGLLIANKNKLQMRWSANSHVSLADREIYAKMKEAGCIELFFGIESGNDAILKGVGKALNTYQAKNAIRLAQGVGLEVGTFFIIGHPNETKKTAMDTIRLAAKLKSTRVAFGKMVPYPGTEVRRMAERGEGGYNYLSRNWNDYVKYGANPLGIKGLSANTITFFQIFAYIYFYARNARIKELIDFLFSHRQTFKSFLKAKLWAVFK
jgi:anaerobic magnesium-protoporphyrin IX monomethyl ester cyclase